MINVMLVDDMEQYTRYYSSIISKEPDMNVVGIAHSGKEAIELAAKCSPDIIVTDVQMETSTTGVDITKELKRMMPQTKIIIMTVHQQKELILKAYEVGISDYLLKTSTAEEFIDTLRNCAGSISTLYSINKIVQDEMLRLKHERSSLLSALTILNRFSKSELQIIECLCRGKKYREIATELYIQETTIRTLVHRIGIKLGNKPIRELISDLKELNATEFLQSLI